VDIKAKNTTRKGFKSSVCAIIVSTKTQIVLPKRRKCPLLNRIFHLRNFTQQEPYRVEVVSLDKAQSPGTSVAIFGELSEKFVTEAIPGAELGESHVDSRLSGWRKQA
jgi:hypothetical protein